MHHPILFLCVALSTAHAFYLGLHPPVVSIPWRNALLPCECTQSVLDCSERSKSFLRADDIKCDGPIGGVNLFDNLLVTFPDGLQEVSVVNASRNRFVRPPQASQLSSSVILLDLSENNISDIGSEFSHLGSLQILQLRRNSLRDLLFLPLPCVLIDLEVGDNQIVSLDGPIRHCNSLQMLDLSGNNITTLPENVFSNHPELVVLDLSLNAISPLSRNIFSPLRRLKELRLEGVGLEVIPDGLLDNLSNLEYLSLDGNKISTVTPLTFSGLVNLMYLSISKNSLTIFPDEGLGNLSALEELHVAGNELKTLPSAAFVSLPRLKLLNLDANNITSLPDDVFSGLSHLSAVFLRDEAGRNPASFSVFANVNSLQLLSVTSQNFRQELFKPIVHVPYIQCFRCGLTTLQSRTFKEFQDLTALSIEYNNITSIDGNVLEGLDQLKYLSLGGNGITALPADIFTHTRQLSRLHLWDNRLNSLPENIFSGMNLLQEITLNQNNLTSLPENIFHGLQSLLRLDLSHNHFTSLEPNLFSNLTLLWELNLANNFITTLPPFDTSCVSLRAVSFENNDFSTLDQAALQTWLYSGANQRFLNLGDTASKIEPQFVSWLARESELKIRSGDECGCGVIRSDLALVRLCVNMTFAIGSPVLVTPGTEWLSVKNNSEQVISN